MKKLIVPIIVQLSILATSVAYAVPVLQVGAPGAPGSGLTYAPYGSLTNPAEDSTAVTDGNKLFVAGTYQQNDVVNLGGTDWANISNPPGNMTIPSSFNGHGAVLLATYSIDKDPLTNASLSISLDNGVSYFNQFLSSKDLTFPNSHAPLQDSSVTGYYYFDIGSFLKTNSTVPNFNLTDSDQTTKPGEIKTILFTETGLDWIHFDVMAVEESQDIQGGGKKAHLVTTWDLENNPGSHDVTWKDGGGGGREVVPEPGTIALVGAGLVGLVLYRRKTKA